MVERTRSQWLPRKERLRKSLTGVAYRSDGSWLRVHMTNLSYDGCHLLTDGSLDLAEAMTIVMPRMQHLKGQVRWVTDGQAGVRFLTGDVVGDRYARLGL